jgi:hypothetical protein
LGHPEPSTGPPKVFHRATQASGGFAEHLVRIENWLGRH